MNTLATNSNCPFFQRVNKKVSHTNSNLGIAVGYLYNINKPLKEKEGTGKLGSDSGKVIKKNMSLRVGQQLRMGQGASATDARGPTPRINRGSWHQQEGVV